MSKLSDIDVEVQERLNQKIQKLKRLGLYEDYMLSQLYQNEMKEEILRDIMLEMGELRLMLSAKMTATKIIITAVILESQS